MAAAAGAQSIAHRRRQAEPPPRRKTWLPLNKSLRANGEYGGGDERSGVWRRSDSSTFNREADREHGGLCAGPARAGGAGGRGGRVTCGRGGAGTRLLAASGVNR